MFLISISYTLEKEEQILETLQGQTDGPGWLIESEALRDSSREQLTSRHHLVSAPEKATIPNC